VDGRLSPGPALETVRKGTAPAAAAATVVLGLTDVRTTPPVGWGLRPRGRIRGRVPPRLRAAVVGELGERHGVEATATGVTGPGDAQEAVVVSRFSLIFAALPRRSRR
jgi:hypothetical protein